jgi:hypothetical protein
MVSSAFGIVNHRYLTKSSQEVFVLTAPTTVEQSIEIQRKHQATLMCQAAEWEMQGIQSSFPCLKDTFTYKEKGEHWIMMKMIILL